MGRMSALDAGYDVRASGVTLDRYCGSGITAVSLAAAQIMSGMEDLVIGGGTEMMSYTAASAPKPDPEAGPVESAGPRRRPRTAHGAGWMFWLKRKTLVGSYRFLMAASRS